MKLDRPVKCEPNNQEIGMPDNAYSWENTNKSNDINVSVDRTIDVQIL